MTTPSTTRCADAGDLCHFGRSPIVANPKGFNKSFHGKSRWDFTRGSRHGPLTMSAWRLNLKRRVFQSVFGLVWAIPSYITPGFLPFAVLTGNTAQEHAQSQELHGVLVRTSPGFDRHLVAHRPRRRARTGPRRASAFVVLTWPAAFISLYLHADRGSRNRIRAVHGYVRLQSSGCSRGQETLFRPRRHTCRRTAHR